MWSLKSVLGAAIAGISVTACVTYPSPDEAPGSCSASASREGPCAAPGEAIQLNDVQAAGSHNSYKQAIPAPELALIRQTSSDAAAGLDYWHAPLTDQLNLGMRQLELDVYYDPEGGRYANPMLARATIDAPGAVPFDTAARTAPGYKVMHIQDIDVRSSCPTFIGCLAEINAWSLAHPDHTPILILINAKDDNLDAPGTVKALPFDAAAFDALDAEILSVFDTARLITPDEVRSGAASLREGVLAGGWPELGAARGRVLFALDETPAKVETYLRGHASLEGAPMFVNSVNEDAPHAAYFTLNDPIAMDARIRAAVQSGFLVRTRADANTLEARTNDTTRREAAFASGAHYVSTDYYHPRPELSDYVVALPGETPARCNPVRRNAMCAPRTE